jgi:hypothetical protein
MTTFSEWLRESEQDARERLEAAVREYMSKNTPPKQCYYIPSPNKMDFDPSNPKHLEDELGPDYDRSLDVIPFKHHPTAFKCRGVADGLVTFLRDKGFRARVIAGWYGNADKGYRTGGDARLYAASPPQDFRGRGSRQEHWWVEAEGQYVDLTSAQFHPTSPKDQRHLVIRDKRTAFGDGEYAAVRRSPLRRAVPLPPEATRMIDKIISLKKFQNGKSSNYSDVYNLTQWILKNAPKYGMEDWRAKDITMSIEEMGEFYFADRTSMEALFGEGYDDMEEDESLKGRKSNFVPPVTTSRGTVRFRKNFVSLSSVSPEGMEENMEVLKSLIKSHNPGVIFGDNEKRSMPARGGDVYYVEADMEGTSWPIFTPELEKSLKKERFRIGD